MTGETVLTRNDISLCVKIHEICKCTILRFLADGDEQTGHRNRFDSAGVLIGYIDALEFRIPVQLCNGAVQNEFHVIKHLEFLRVSFRAAELVSAVDEIDLIADAGKIECIAECSVAASVDGDVLLSEKHSVAGGAVGDAFSDKFVFAGDAEVTVPGAGCKDDGAACEFAVIAGFYFEQSALACLYSFSENS